MAVPPGVTPVTGGENEAYKQEAWWNPTSVAGPTLVPRTRSCASGPLGGAVGRKRRRDSEPRGGAVGLGREAAGGGGRGGEARVGRTGSGGGPVRMAAAVAMAAASCGGAGAARSLSRFRGCLAGALLGDCVGAIYEAHDTVSLTSVLRHVQSLEPDPGSAGSARTGGRGRALQGLGRRGSREGRGAVGARPGEGVWGDAAP